MLQLALISVIGGATLTSLALLLFPDMPVYGGSLVGALGGGCTFLASKKLKVLLKSAL